MRNFHQSSKDIWQNSVFFIIALLLTLVIIWQIIEQANTNHDLEQQAAQLQAEIDLLTQQKANQTLNNQFLRSDYYLDLALREQRGLLLPDESLLNIDKNKIAELKVAYQPAEQQEPINQDKPLSNLEQWWNFIFNSQPNP